MSKRHKQVLMPIRVCRGKYCFTVGNCGDANRICSHFTLDGGDALCEQGMGEIKTDRTGYYRKPKTCLNLKEIK